MRGRAPCAPALGMTAVRRDGVSRQGASDRHAMHRLSRSPRLYFQLGPMGLTPRSQHSRCSWSGRTTRRRTSYVQRNRATRQHKAPSGDIPGHWQVSVPGRQPGQVGELHELNRRAQTQADLKVQSWLGVARRVIDLLERPFRREPVADRAPERNVEFSSTRAHPRLHVGVSRSGAIGIDVDAAHDIVALWL